MIRTEVSQWRRLERWRRRSAGESGLRQTVTGLWIVTDADLAATVFFDGHDHYRPQNPFFVVAGGLFMSGPGPLADDVRRAGLSALMRVLAHHRFPSDEDLLAACLPAPERLTLQGWGTLFLRHAYADILAYDRQPAVTKVIDQFVAVNLVRRGIQGRRWQFGVTRFRHLARQLAPALVEPGPGWGTADGPRDLIDVVTGIPGALTALDRAELYLRLLTALLFATGVALEWTVILAARHPRATELVATDIAAEATVREALRLYPTAWAPVRTAVDDHELGGRRIAAGDDLVVLNYLIQRRAAYWPDPDDFRPGRMLAPTPPARGVYQPFAAGPTGCPARTFATKTLTRSVGAILRAYDVEVRINPHAVPMVRFLLAPPPGELLLRPRDSEGAALGARTG